MSTPANQPLIENLTSVLADTYALMIKTHGAHWNVTGPAFFQLHEAFGSQYEALFEAADELAERLRALGAAAPTGIQDLARRTSLAVMPAGDAGQMVRTLRDDHHRLTMSCKQAIAVAAAAGDEATADLLTARIEDHDKTAWMLGAQLG